MPAFVAPGGDGDFVYDGPAHGGMMAVGPSFPDKPPDAKLRLRMHFDGYNATGTYQITVPVLTQFCSLLDGSTIFSSPPVSFVAKCISSCGPLTATPTPTPPATEPESTKCVERLGWARRPARPRALWRVQARRGELLHRLGPPWQKRALPACAERAFTRSGEPRVRNWQG